MPQVGLRVQQTQFSISQVIFFRLLFTYCPPVERTSFQSHLSLSLSYLIFFGLMCQMHLDCNQTTFYFTSHGPSIVSLSSYAINNHAQHSSKCNNNYQTLTYKTCAKFNTKTSLETPFSFQMWAILARLWSNSLFLCVARS